MSPIKELRFFAFEGEDPDFRGPLLRDPETPWANRPWGTVTDLEAYRALFGDVTDETAVGEACPYYLYSEKAPGRIRHYVPEAKLIAILRDPAQDLVHPKALPKEQDPRSDPGQGYEVLVDEHPVGPDAAYAPLPAGEGEGGRKHGRVAYRRPRL